MFTTTDSVLSLTGYEVRLTDINMAQAIIESYVGKVEAEVYDANDLMLLDRATAYQAAYMVKNKELVFEQMSAQQIMQFGQMVTFKQDDAAPFIAPLAILACKRLSWKRIRSIRTGRIFDNGPVQTNSWERD